MYWSSPFLHMFFCFSSNIFCWLNASCFSIISFIIFNPIGVSQKSIVWISSKHVVFNLCTLLNIWNLSSTHTFFNIICLFQFNFFKTNNQGIHIGGIDTFSLFDFPYFFPLCQANEVTKALFSLPWTTIITKITKSNLINNKRNRM